MNEKILCDNCGKDITGDMNYWWFGDNIYCDECYDKVKDDE